MEDFLGPSVRKVKSLSPAVGREGKCEDAKTGRKVGRRISIWIAFDDTPVNFSFVGDDDDWAVN